MFPKVHLCTVGFGINCVKAQLVALTDWLNYITLKITFNLHICITFCYFLVRNKTYSKFKFFGKIKCLVHVTTNLVIFIQIIILSRIIKLFTVF